MNTGSLSRPRTEVKRETFNCFSMMSGVVLNFILIFFKEAVASLLNNKVRLLTRTEIETLNSAYGQSEKSENDIFIRTLIEFKLLT